MRKVKPPAAELRAVLLEKKGSVPQTADHFGVHRVTVYEWMRDYGISLERRPVAVRAAE